MTRWAKDVKPDKVLPEYPRPQMERSEWQNLNGLWDYAIVGLTACRPGKWDGKILVPFPVESVLSGVKRSVTDQQRIWYHRTFKLPSTWKDQHVLLHFGAVDWEATVFVNGVKAGVHRGGYDPFSFDITPELKPSGDQEITVAVFDPSDAGTQPRGKQVRQANGIWYTSSSGIWQTVWLEPVPASHVKDLKITPDFDADSVTVQGHVIDCSSNAQFMVDVLNGGKVIGRASAAVTNALLSGPSQMSPPVMIKISNARAWTPDSPHLYNLRVTLVEAGRKVDQVKSYFGLRKIALGHDKSGIERLMLNNRPLFEFGPLDQGFWPGGLYTAPTDQARRYDIEVAKQLGFNMIRKHVKVEPDRWYYWCDKLGLLVWQDMPSGDRETGEQGSQIQRTAQSAAEYERELKAMIKDHYNHPCIVMWVPFNEGWGQFDTARITKLVKQWDPTRLVDSASGWLDYGVGDVHDIHHYPAPVAPPLEEHRAGVLGEFGGLGLPIKGHTWQKEKNWGYHSYQNAGELTDAYLRLIGQLHPLTGADGLAAAVFTQLTDVEGEVNGLLTYDRAVIKMKPKVVAEANRKLYTPPPDSDMELKTLVPAADELPSIWRYTTARPATHWFQPGFNDAGWELGRSGFGSDGTPGAVIGTQWRTADIWLRREFTMPSKPWGDLECWLHHDEDAEIYINGVLALQVSGWSQKYEAHPLTTAGRAAFKLGKNTLAVHCHQTTGGQYVDVGFVTMVSAQTNTNRWTRERAWNWYHHQPWLCGFNYIPANAISYTEMWMDYDFDPKLIAGELALAQKVGFNCLRVVLSYVVWKAQPEAFKRRFDAFLSLCDKHGIKVMPCFFDDCVFGPITDPVFGRQPAVVPGWYANGWTPSPGHERVRDVKLRPSLESFVKDVMTAYRDDPQILCWDLYNEPGNSGMGNASLPLLRDTFRWARTVNPVQPLTSGIWGGSQRITDFLRNHSDIITFHNYSPPDKLRQEISDLKRLGRPLICSEWLNRPLGSTVAGCLPVFAEENVGCLNWGLVNGKTQTNLNWGHRPGDPAPKIWQHDLFRPDHQPYDPQELDLFHQTIFRESQAGQK